MLISGQGETCTNRVIFIFPPKDLTNCVGSIPPVGYIQYCQAFLGFRPSGMRRYPSPALRKRSFSKLSLLTKPAARWCLKSLLYILS